MKTTTAKFKQILASKNAREYVIKIDLVLANGTTKHLTGEDIWEDSFSIDTASSGTSSLDIGTAVIGQCKFTLNNIEGDYDNIDFFNAHATVWLGLKGDVSGSTQQYYRMGFFTVDEPSKANGLISLTLLDNMWKFDVPFSEAGVTFTSQTTARTIVLAMCSHCGVTLATQNFHGYDFSITQAPDNIDEMNCREMLQYIAMIGCNFCYIDDSGALNIKWYNTSATSAQTVTFDLNQSTQFGTDDITVTGVKFILDDTEYSIGTSGYRLELTNPLVNENNVSTVLNLIWSVLQGFTFRTFNVTSASDLSAEIGDKVKIKDYKGNYVYSYITLNSFRLYAHLIQCNATPPNRTLVKRYSSQVKAAVEVARQQAEQLISNYDLSVQRLNKLVEQSMGAFSDYEDAPNGGRIYYISNMPITKNAQTGECEFEQGSTVFRMAGDVFSVSQDGGQTWVNGYDPSTGELIVNVLNAIGINAEWVRTGTLTVGGTTSGTQHPTIEVYDASDNLIVEINRNGITMHRGIISSPDYAEEQGATYSTTGMKIDILNKILRSPYFAIDTSGAYFKGEILITDEIELPSGSFTFVPAEYGIFDDFIVQLAAPEGYSGSATYTVVRTNGSSSSTEASGTITAENPIDFVGLQPLIPLSGYYYEFTVSDSSIDVTIPQATLAYVGREGLKGHLQGVVDGNLYSDYGNINGLRYGVDSSGDRLMQGVFDFPNYYHHCFLDFANSIWKLAGSDGTNPVASVSLEDEGAVHVFGDGDGDGTVLRINDGSHDMYIRNTASHGMTIFRDYPDGQGSYILEEIVWDDGSFYKKTDIQKSTSDSPPQTLADGQLFLVYEN